MLIWPQAQPTPIPLAHSVACMPRSIVMSQEFAYRLREAQSEFLALNHTRNSLMLLVRFRDQKFVFPVDAGQTTIF
jgi:hypothetical protein